MKKNFDPCRHDFVLLRRLLKDIRKGQKPSLRRLRASQECLEHIMMQYFVKGVIPRPGYYFDYDSLLWRKTHYIKRHGSGDCTKDA